MNFAHLHLVLTHFPPVLSVGAVVAAAAGFLLPRRRVELLRLAALLIVTAGAFAPVVYVVGNRAADTIGRVEGIDQEAIAPHQRAAAISVWVSVAAAVVTMVMTRRGISRSAAIVILVAAVAAAVTIGRAAALGGEIHHPEVRQTRPKV